MSDWDHESEAFRGEGDDIDPRVADNILVAWPSIHRLIRTHLSAKHRPLSLDLGCGTGWLCTKLAGLGFNVIGVDPSGKMLEIARSACPKSIQLIQGDFETVLSFEARFDLVVGCMVFQFIADARTLARHINGCLQAHGLLIFAVFNPAFEQACADASVLIYPAGPEHSWDYELQLTGSERFPMYSRDVDYYREIFESSGFEFIESDAPDYPPGYVEKYAKGLPTKHPEFLILAFKKILSV